MFINLLIVSMYFKGGINYVEQLSIIRKKADLDKE